MESRKILQRNEELNPELEKAVTEGTDATSEVERSDPEAEEGE